MTNPYRVYIRSISTDGTSLFLEIELFDGLHTLPTLHPSFAVGTSAATITNYLQTIANTQPTLDPTLQALVGTFVNGQ